MNIMLERTLPIQGNTDEITLSKLQSVIIPSLTPLEHAHALFSLDIPESTVLHIQETDGKLIAKYIYRLTYTSPKSGRSMNMVAKGDSLPQDRDECYYFYLRQIVLSPTEIAREFSRLYFLERRSRQDNFLNNKNNIRVSDKGLEPDRLPFGEYE